MILVSTFKGVYTMETYLLTYHRTLVMFNILNLSNIVYVTGMYTNMLVVFSPRGLL